MSPADLKAVQKLRPLAAGDKLEHGRTYYAKLQLVGLEAAFGDADQIARKMSDGGFLSVLVSKEPIGDVPDRERFKSGMTFWARGVWGGQEKQLGGGAVPAQVKAIWESPIDALEAGEVTKLKELAPRAPAKSQGPTLQQLALVGGAIYLWRSRFARRFLARLGLRRA